MIIWFLFFFVVAIIILIILIIIYLLLTTEIGLLTFIGSSNNLNCLLTSRIYAHWKIIYGHHVKFLSSTCHGLKLSIYHQKMLTAVEAKIMNWYARLYPTPGIAINVIRENLESIRLSSNNYCDQLFM